MEVGRGAWGKQVVGGLEGMGFSIPKRRGTERRGMGWGRKAGSMSSIGLNRETAREGPLQKHDRCLCKCSAFEEQLHTPPGPHCPTRCRPCGAVVLLQSRTPLRPPTAAAWLRRSSSVW
jgi:hypothetical protein